MKSKWWIFSVIFLIVMILPLGYRPMFSPDESRYAEIAREMLVSGDWVSPHLNGVRYFEKPVFGYWLFAGSMKVFGVNAFALRFPGALLTGLTGLLVALLLWFERRRWQDAAALGAAVYLTIPLVFVIGTLGILDAIFAFFVTGCCVFFYIAEQIRSTPMEISPGRKTILCLLLLVLTGVFAGTAFLVKGFLGFILPGIAAFGWLCWEKRWKELLIMPWLPLVAALAVIAPWAYLIHKAEADFWHYFVVVEHWQRFFGGENAQHAASVFYFIPVLLGGAAPWLLLAPVIWKHLKKDFLHDSLLKWSLCWFLLPFLLLSCSSGKLATYILPCFAPLAVIIACGLSRYLQQNEPKKYLDMLTRILAAALLLCIIGISVNHLTGFPGMKLFGKSEVWKWLLVVIGGTLALLAAFNVKIEKTSEGKINYFLLFLIVPYFCYHFILPDYIIERRCPTEMLKRLQPEIPANSVIISLHYPFQDVCWTFQNSNVWMITPGEIKYGLNHPEDKHRLLSIHGLNRLIAEQKKNGDHAVLVMATNHYERWSKAKRFKEKPIREIHGADEDCYSVIFY